MLRKVMIYGELGKRFGRTHRFAVSSPAEALRALAANYEGFERALTNLDKSGRGVRIVVDKSGIDRLDDIHAPSAGTIKIIPTVIGARKSAIGQIFSAIILAVATYYTGGALGTAGYGSAASTVTTVGYSMAISMAIGGIAQLIAGTPKTTQADKNASTVFNGAINVSAQGNPVPIGYGRRIVGSAVISAGISVTQAGGGSTQVLNGIYPRPVGAIPPTIVWNAEARHWEEMDGTPLVLVPDYLERVPHANYWRTTDGRIAYFNETTQRWDVPDSRAAAMWDGRYGLWCLNTGINGGGPCFQWDATNKYFVIMTSDQFNEQFTPSEPNYAG